MFRKFRLAGLVVLVVVLVSLSFLGGAITSPLATAQTGVDSNPPAGVSKDFQVFWEAWNVAQKNYVDKSKLDPKQMTYGAIAGMLDSLGDQGHTRFLTPADVKLEATSLQGSFEGIGAEIQQRDSRPIIVAPMDGSPAEKAGILAGDTILSVNGQDTLDMSISKVVSLVRGPKGTSVTLTVLHPGETSTTDITIVRQEIKVDPVSWHYLSSDKIAHIRLSEFSDGASDQVAKAIQQAKQDGARGIVLDLRDDPGGLVGQVMNIGSQFLPAGKTIFIEQDSKGNRTAQVAQAGGTATGLPMVVLVNEGSASAAEILAGAIQDNHRGVVIGERTFGTGTVLTNFDLSDGSSILLGIAEWLTPNGSAIKGKGIGPDLTVKLPGTAQPLSSRAEASMTDGQIMASTDLQLRAAIQYLMGGHSHNTSPAVGYMVPR